MPNQPSPNGILQQIFNLFIEVLRTSQYMIERLGLPYPSLSTHCLVDLVSGGSFDGIHDSCQRANFHGFVVDQRSKNQVHVIWHDNYDFQVVALTVVMETTFQSDRPSGVRKDPPALGTEGHEMRLVIDLKMRKLPPIKSLRHGKTNVGTAAIGCPAEQSSARLPC